MKGPVANNQRVSELTNFFANRPDALFPMESADAVPMKNGGRMQ